MNYNIKNKIALITGASRGIGEEICRSLAKEVAVVVACARNKKHLLKLISSFMFLTALSAELTSSVNINKV